MSRLAILFSKYKNYLFDWLIFALVNSYDLKTSDGDQIYKMKR